jgi:hypothetical protein
MQNTDLHAHNLTQAVDSCNFSPGFLAVHASNSRDVMKVIVLYNAVIPCEVGDPL